MWSTRHWDRKMRPISGDLNTAVGPPTDGVTCNQRNLRPRNPSPPKKDNFCRPPLAMVKSIDKSNVTWWPAQVIRCRARYHPSLAFMISIAAFLLEMLLISVKMISRRLVDWENSIGLAFNEADCSRAEAFNALRLVLRNSPVILFLSSRPTMMSLIEANQSRRYCLERFNNLSNIELTFDNI